LSLLRALTTRHLRHDDADPFWADRDRLLTGTAPPDLPQGAAITITGPPGLAFGAATGMAIAERMLAARFGRSLVDHRVWLLAEPRDLVSGTAQEAMLVASALMLGRLTALANLPQQDTRLFARFTACGWTVRTIAAGDEPAADVALSAACRSQKPSLIVAIGRAGDTRAAPDAAIDQSARRSGPSARRAWLKRLRRHANRDSFQQAWAGHLPPGWHRLLHEDTAGHAAGQSTAAAAQATLGRLGVMLPDLVFLPEQRPPSAVAPHHQAAFASGSLCWDGLDLAAPAATLGLALHGGLLPFGWSSGTEANLAHPALSEAARHGARLLHITADADPFAMAPDTTVYAPADAAELADCLVLALRRNDAPSVLMVSTAAPALLPQGTPRLCARGAYLLHAPAARDLTLVAAGASMPRALAVHGALTRQGVSAALVSLPCRALFDVQEEGYRRNVLGTARLVAFAGPRFVAGLAGHGDLILGAEHGSDPDAVASLMLAFLHRTGGAAPSEGKERLGGMCHPPQTPRHL
jgi:transketolase